MLPVTEPANGARARTAGSRSVKIVVGGWEYDMEAGFTDAAGIKDNPWGYGLVGQIGFFEFFTVRFKYRKGAIEFAQNVKG